MTYGFTAPLYPIVDVTAESRHPAPVLAAAVLSTGVRTLQLRAKRLPTGRFVAVARALQAIAGAHGADLIVNDRADVALLVGAAGVHLGQKDLPPGAARRILGPHRVIGLSTHSLPELADALATGVLDYVAFGPIFPTASKENSDPAQGLEKLAEARRLCPLPLVAIGGITAERAADVLAAGADAVAVIGAISTAEDPRAAALEFTTPRDPRRS